MKKLTANQKIIQQYLLRNMSIDEVSLTMARRFDKEKVGRQAERSLSYWRNKIIKLINAGSLVA